MRMWLAYQMQKAVLVTLYPDPETPEAVRVTLEETRKENKLLRAKVRRQEDVDRWKNEMPSSAEFSLASFDPVKDGDKIVFELFRDSGDRQSYIVWDTKNLSP